MMSPIQLTMSNWYIPFDGIWFVQMYTYVICVCTCIGMCVCVYVCVIFASKLVCFVHMCTLFGISGFDHEC